MRVERVHEHNEGICERCDSEVFAYPGDDIICDDCGAQYNCFGQRLRDDWRDNPSNWDSEMGDMEGYEIEQLRKEMNDEHLGR